MQFLSPPHTCKSGRKTGTLLMRRKRAERLCGRILRHPAAAGGRLPGQRGIRWRKIAAKTRHGRFAARYKPILESLWTNYACISLYLRHCDRCGRGRGGLHGGGGGDDEPLGAAQRAARGKQGRARNAQGGAQRRAYDRVTCPHGRQGGTDGFPPAAASACVFRVFPPQKIWKIPAGVV